VMKALMRTVETVDRKNPFWANAKKSAWLWLGPISGSHQGQRPNGRTQRPNT